MRISDWSSDVCSSDLDGFICTAAIAPLAAENPAIVGHCIAGHCSAEPGHRRLLALLGLDPLLSLDMRLGEGSGAAVAANIVRSALAAHDRMATYIGRASCRDRVCQYV